MLLVAGRIFLDVVGVAGGDDDDDDTNGGGGGSGARNQIQIMQDLPDFGSLRAPRITEDLFHFDTSRPSRAD